ncbi:MAG: hypothetical protein ACR2J3_04165 [Aridibacter sp.]
MKRFLIISLFSFFGIIFFGVIFAYFNQSSAQKVTNAQWEYAVVTDVYFLQPEPERINKIIGIANVCLARAAGCKQLVISEELDYAKYLKDANLPETFGARQTASLKIAEIAFQKALAQLGNDGWELIAEPKQEFKSVSLYNYEKFEDKSLLFTKTNTQAVYFKRLKNGTYNGKE